MTLFPTHDTTTNNAARRAEQRTAVNDKRFSHETRWQIFRFPLEVDYAYANGICSHVPRRRKQINVLSMRSQQARAPTTMTLAMVAARCRLGEFLSGSVYANEGNGGNFFFYEVHALSHSIALSPSFSLTHSLTLSHAYSLAPSYTHHTRHLPPEHPLVQGQKTIDVKPPRHRHRNCSFTKNLLQPIHRRDICNINCWRVI